jgi:hypothetical protein
MAWGAADANRVLVAAFYSRQTNTTDDVSSVSFGATSATRVSGAFASPNAQLASTDIWYASVAAGTSGNVTVTWTGNSVRSAMFIGRLITATPTPTAATSAKGNGTGLTSSSLTIPSGGAGIVVYGTRDHQSANITWSNASEYAEEQVASFLTAGAATVTATGTVNAFVSDAGVAGDAMSLAAWGN